MQVERPTRLGVGLQEVYSTAADSSPGSRDGDVAPLQFPTVMPEQSVAKNSETNDKKSWQLERLFYRVPRRCLSWLHQDWRECHGDGLEELAAHAIRSAVGIAYVNRDYAEAISLAIGDSSAYNSLAWLYATAPEAQFRDRQQSVALSLKSCELANCKDYAKLDTLAAAYAESGEFDKAIRWQRKAIQLGSESAETDEVLQRLDLYESGRPYREPAPDKRKKDRWRLDYNHHRIHSSLNYMTPAAYAATCVLPASARLRLQNTGQIIMCLTLGVVQVSGGSHARY